jgi:hypothetical protein
MTRLVQTSHVVRGAFMDMLGIICRNALQGLYNGLCAFNPNYCWFLLFCDFYKVYELPVCLGRW